MNVQNVLKHLDQLFAAKKYEEVEPFLLSHIEEAEKEEDYGAMLTLYNELTGYYRSISKVEESVDTAEALLELCLRMKIEGSSAHATSMLNAATSYRAAGATERAIALYDKCADIYQAELEESDERIASLYNNMSLAYQETENTDKALAYLKKALAVVENSAGREIETGITCTNIASLMFGTGRLDEGLAYLDKALEAYGENGKADPHYASALAAKAHGYYLTKDYNKSIDTYAAAFKNILEHFGENDAYAVTCENCALVLEEAGCSDEAENLRKRARKVYQQIRGYEQPIKGLQLSREYYEAYGRAMIARQFPDYADRIAVGLAGSGSECFGFDDEFSQDHDFGPSFCMWLTKEDYAKIGKQLQQAYEQLPGGFMGYPARTVTEHGAGRVGVLEIEGFYAQFIGTEQPPEKLRSWLHIPEHLLATAVNGTVFEDPLGQFTKVRSELKKGYPEDVRMKKLAARIAVMGQSGQYNYSRCMHRGDITAAALAEDEFIKAAISAVYLLNNKYMPYYKWASKGMAQLKLLSEVKPLLEQLILAPLDCGVWRDVPQHAINQNDRKTVLIEEICKRIREELKKQNLTDIDDDFLENHTGKVMACIKDQQLRALHVMEG